ncbi:MAG TPA: hypothetical protein VIQ52_09400 [Arthrobacter sp.]
MTAPTLEELAQAFDIGPYITGAHFFWHAQDELLWRLNTRLQGSDPGRPVNWRGAGQNGRNGRDHLHP